MAQHRIVNPKIAGSIPASPAMDIQLRRRSTPDSLRYLADQCCKISSVLDQEGMGKMAIKQLGIATQLRMLADQCEDEQRYQGPLV